MEMRQAGRVETRGGKERHNVKHGETEETKMYFCAQMVNGN